MQVVPGAAVVRSSLLDSHILGPNRNIKLRFLAPEVGCEQLSRADFQNRNPLLATAEFTSQQVLYTNRQCDFGMLRTDENFLRRTTLQDSAPAHQQHLIAEGEGINPV